ncbi:putative programmed cell death protein [Plasmopara halstedii]
MDPPSEANNLTCSKCSKALFLVAQVYAPVEMDRTLYVFGCNSKACTENPGSWRVLRDQINSVTRSTEVQIEEMSKQVDRIKVAWGSDSDGSDWSSDEDDIMAPVPTIETADLEMLLQQRNEVMKSSAMKSKSTSVFEKVKNEKESDLSGKQNAFPALAIEVIEEPFEDYLAEHDFEHENRLLEEYMKLEEEEKSTDLNDLRTLITNLKKKEGSLHSGKVGQNESYERTPAQQRHLLRFQKRIRRCPLQCLRYDYGGEPLWPVVAPQNLKVPPCPGCGQERFFEMQLTPTMIYFLNVDQYISTDNVIQQQPTSLSDDSRSRCDAHKALAPFGGMDWLSLIVYSCSASCAHSHEEFVYVVP